jgi:hypothetical protein
MMKYEVMTSQQHLVFNASHRESLHWTPEQLLQSIYPRTSANRNTAEIYRLDGSVKSVFSLSWHEAQSSEQFVDIFAVTNHESVALLGIFNQDQLWRWYPKQALIGEWMLQPILGPAEIPSYEKRLENLRRRHEGLWLVRVILGMLFVCGLWTLFTTGFKSLSDPQSSLQLALAVLAISVAVIFGSLDYRKKRLLYPKDELGSAESRSGSKSTA